MADLPRCILPSTFAGGTPTSDVPWSPGPSRATRRCSGRREEGLVLNASAPHLAHFRGRWKEAITLFTESEFREKKIQALLLGKVYITTCGKGGL